MRSKEKVDRLVYEILSVLEENKDDGPMGARAISRELKDRGFEIGERAIRYHLEQLDEKGLTEKPGPRKGRLITETGEKELSDDLVGGRVGFIIGRIEELTYEMDYDLQTGEGEVVTNVSLLKEEDKEEALEIMHKVMEGGWAPSPLFKISEEGERIGNVRVPEGKIGVATVCSITIDGLLENEGIPVSPSFGGVLEVEDEKPKRFVDAISYRGTSLDPFAVFSSKDMTSYLSVIETGSGRVLANLREIPISARPSALEILDEANERGLDAVLEVGSPGESLFGLSVDVNRVGIVIAGGINPAVAVEESGIEVETIPMESLMDISEMKYFRDYSKFFGVQT